MAGVKVEQGSVEEEILALLLTVPEGVGDDVLIKRLPGVEPLVRSAAGTEGLNGMSPRFYSVELYTVANP